MSGVNGNVIMSGWGNGHHPDNATTKADRNNRESFKERSDGDCSSLTREIFNIVERSKAIRLRWEEAESKRLPGIKHFTM
jgi:hypothetical protein